MNDRPWANGLHRLLSERRGLKKGQLAEMAKVRPALISAVANSDTPPQVTTLQRIADGFTKYDRRHAPDAPAVELWEFFVSDDQAALLRNRAVKAREESADEALLKRIASVVADVVKQDRSERQSPPPPAIVEHPRKKRSNG